MTECIQFDEEKSTVTFLKHINDGINSVEKFWALKKVKNLYPTVCWRWVHYSIRRFHKYQLDVTDHRPRSGCMYVVSKSSQIEATGFLWHFGAGIPDVWQLIQ